MTIFRFSLILSMLTLAACQNAEDSQRIDKLQGEVASLEQRLQRAETQLKELKDRTTLLTYAMPDPMGDLRNRAKDSRDEAERAELDARISRMERDKALDALLRQ